MLLMHLWRPSVSRGRMPAEPRNFDLFPLQSVTSHNHPVLPRRSRAAGKSNLCPSIVSVHNRQSEEIEYGRQNRGCLLPLEILRFHAAGYSSPRRPESAAPAALL